MLKFNKLRLVLGMALKFNSRVVKWLKLEAINTAQKMKFSIKDFFSKCDQIRSFLQCRDVLKANSYFSYRGKTSHFEHSGVLLKKKTNSLAILTC